MQAKDFKKLLESGYIDLNQMDEAGQNALFDQLNQEMMAIYQFVLLYTEYMNAGHDYQAEEKLTMLEAHLLTDICSQPEQTVTKLAAAWHRSVSATSQTIRKLIGKDLIYRQNSPENASVFYLYPTEKGLRASRLHQQYDIIDTVKTLKCLHHELSYEEIETLFRAVKIYNSLLHGES